MPPGTLAAGGAVETLVGAPGDAPTSRDAMTEPSAAVTAATSAGGAPPTASGVPATLLLDAL